VLLREGEEMTGGQLLERFISRRESVALEAQARRHGPTAVGNAP
jgi:hypothetical protein